MTTRLQSARLLRRDDIFAQVSGDHRRHRTRERPPNVAGDVTSDLIEINVGGALPAIHRRSAGRGAQSAGRGGKRRRCKTARRRRRARNVKRGRWISPSPCPAGCFIRGRGLDSEWSGRFKVKGTADAPVIEGDLSPVRGDFSFAGKSFKLQKGKVSLAGGEGSRSGSGSFRGLRTG